MTTSGMDLPLSKCWLHWPRMLTWQARTWMTCFWRKACVCVCVWMYRMRQNHLTMYLLFPTRRRIPDNPAECENYDCNTDLEWVLVVKVPSHLVIAPSSLQIWHARVFWLLHWLPSSTAKRGPFHCWSSQSCLHSSLHFLLLELCVLWLMISFLSFCFCIITRVHTHTHTHT